jgi:sulfatase maturation enzyme AslB (radical SAM superfamily)
MMIQLNLVKNMVASNFTRLRFPYKLTFVATYRCQSRCVACDIWKKRPVGELTLEEIRQFFKTSNKFSWIDITGGEVFLRQDVVDIVKAMLDNCKNLYAIHIPTNCLAPALIERRVKEILALKPNYFTITCSLDGPRELNDKLRGIPGDFDKVIDTYKRLSQLQAKNFKIFIGFTLSHLNVGKFDEMYQEVKKQIPWITPNHFHMNIIHLSEHYYANMNLSVKKEGFIEEIEHFRKMRLNEFGPIPYLEKKYLKLAKKYVQTGKTPITCQALAGSVFIDSYGYIYPCSIYGRRFANIKDIGYDLEAYWQHPDIVRAREEIVSGKCPNCWTPCEAYQSIIANIGKV